MNLSAASIRYRTIVITVCMLLLAWGIYSYNTMPRREDPEYTVRTCAVITSWPGAPAEKVEELLTYAIEEAIDSIEEVEHVRSTSTAGLSEIYVDALETVSPEAIDNVWDKVRARVARVQMPEPGITPVVNDEYGDTSVLVACVYQTPLPGESEIREENRYTLRELDLFSEHIRDSLRLLPEVAKAEQFGVVEEAVYLETDLSTWSQLSLTIAQLQQLLEARNIVAPGGEIETEVGRYSVKPGGEFDAVDEVNSVIVNTGTDADAGRPIYLRDLGLTIRRGYEDPPRRICRFGDGDSSEPCVVVALTLRSGYSIVDLCDKAKARMEQMQRVERSLPDDIAITYVSDQSQNVNKKINDVVSNVVGAIVIVVIIVFLFVGFRSAAVMAVNIPLVVLVTIAIVPLFGVQLEQISLASLIIALGLLTDNSVQICYQSRANQMLGMPPREATVFGANQLAIPMMMGMLTTVAAFFPMLIGLIGSTREYVYSLPVTLSVTLITSWVLALTFCVILASALIRAPKDPNQPSAPLPWLAAQIGKLFRRGSPPAADAPKTDLIGRVIEFFVGAAIKFKFFTVIGSVVLLVLAMSLPIGTEFFPKDMRDQFVIQVWLPETSTIAQTDEAAKKVEAILQALSPTTDAEGQPAQRILAMRTMVGGGGSRWYLSWDPEGTKANFAEILVRTTDPNYTPFLAARVREVAERGDPELGLDPVAGVRVVPRELFLGPPADPVALRIMGLGFAEMSTLRGVAEQVKDLIRSQPGTWDISDTWGVPGFQVQVELDEDLANLAGVTNAQVAATLNAYFSGQRLTTFREGDHLVPVYLRLAPGERQSLDGVRTAYVEGTHSKIPLDSIATIESRWEPARIERRDMNRVIEVQSQIEAGVMGNDIVNAILTSDGMKQLEAELPPGYWIEVGGSLEESQQGAEQLAICLSMSLLAIVLLLVVQYNGWAKTTIILMTLPLALVGALPGLYFTGNPLGFMPQLGILSLFGIVLNAGIIFIEFADTLIADRAKSSDGSGLIAGLTKQEFRDCLIEAVKMRFMPIFLTTSTMIGGLLPLALGGGPLWEGMSWCMISGLLIATSLTLLVIPAAYAIFVETFGIQPVPRPVVTTEPQ